MAIDVAFELNGAPVSLTVEPHHTLREALRRLGMFSVRYGSDSGETGAAAVLYDGRLASADVILAASADGHRVTTVESLNVSPELHPIQTAFVAVGAFQSGYSAGAMILGTLALLEESPDPSEDDIRDMLSGILDRETAYTKPVEAVKRAAAVLRGERTEPFAPLMVEPMTDGVRPAPEGSDGPPPEASQAVPRLVPSREVPEMAVVGKPEVKVDAVRLAKGNPAFTDDIEPAGDAVRQGSAQPPRPRPHPGYRRLEGSCGGRRPRRAALRQHASGQVRLGRPELAQPPSLRPGELRRQGPPRGRPGGRRGCRDHRSGRRGPAAHRGGLRGAARGVRRARGHGPRRSQDPR